MLVRFTVQGETAAQIIDAAVDRFKKLGASSVSGVRIEVNPLVEDENGISMWEGEVEARIETDEMEQIREFRKGP